MDATRSIGTTEVRRSPNVVHWLQACGAAVFFGTLGLLPLKWASEIGGYLGRSVGPHLGISKRAQLNLAGALPGLSAAEVEGVIVGMWDNLGRVAAEYPHLRKIRVFQPGGRVETHGFEHIFRAVVAGRQHPPRRLALGAEFPHENRPAVVEPDADHAFFNDTGARYNAAAAGDAWQRLLDWFDRYLTGQ